MDHLNLKVGDKVYFGRSHGEQTLGEVVRVNRVKIKVKQLESRGTYKAHAVGTLWTVPVRLLTKAVDSGPAMSKPVTPARPEVEIMRDIVGIYSSLSPENLSCDGELPRSAVARRAAALNARLRACFTELGRRVSEDEAYKWHDLNLSPQWR